MRINPKPSGGVLVGWRVSVPKSADEWEDGSDARAEPLYGAWQELGKPADLLIDATHPLIIEGQGARLLDAFLAHAGLDEHIYAETAKRARRHGAAVDEELVASGVLTEEHLAEAIARTLDLPFARIEPGITILRNGRGEWQSGQRHLKGCGLGFDARLFISPALDDLAGTAQRIAALGDRRKALCVATRGDIARARADFTQQERADRARLSLAADRNHLSAREVMTAFQAMVATLLVTIVVLAWALLPWFWNAVHMLCSLTAMVLTTFRLAVLSETPPIEEEPGRPSSPDLHEPLEEIDGLPVYSVLVALHREADMAPSIVQAMAALDWPRSKLEVFFVCEASDPETVHAVERAIAGEPNFSVIATPRSDPLTKPKALNFTLPLARGEFLVLYDAEDRPAPRQLRAAFETFRGAAPDLACVQAPLTIRNARAGWFETLFALEYDVLFKATLPWLAAHNLPIPLGGTSNHFRREALVDVGGWDSHNVAEDADLGIRLARAGYRTGVIDAPTSETATGRWRDWRNQRTRWIKGWMQTWLVHMRDPGRLVRDLGWRNLLSFQLVFGGMVASSLLHVVFGIHLVAQALAYAAGQQTSLVFGLLAFLDVSNIILAYAAFIGLASRVTPRSQRGLLQRLWSLWFYWLMVSFAGMRAALQLLHKPHHWEKTPHGPAAARPLPDVGHHLSTP